jgi:hypothetical protein
VVEFGESDKAGGAIGLRIPDDAASADMLAVISVPIEFSWLFLSLVAVEEVH